MTISASVLTQGNSIVPATSFTTASVTLASGKQYVLGYLSVRTLGSPSLPTISGGPTWNTHANVQFNSIASSKSRARVFSVQGDGSTQVLVIDHGATMMDSGAWILVELTGASGAANGIVVQTPANQRGDSSNSLLATLSAFANANNATLGFLCESNTAAITLGSGFSAMGDQTMTALGRLVGEFNAGNDTTVDGTTTGSPHWAVLGCEIAVASGGGLAQRYKGQSPSGIQGVRLF